ncbi:MAG: hypothetical protein M1828_002487 [Chrysothrix sp. TS-e1954]|nr:MAG: hypothetical protein M1828_002487 [Chrysothrix sp. TS-e1954]
MLRALPAKATYLELSNPTRRNALSLSVLRSLRNQLLKTVTSPSDSKHRCLPPFLPAVLRSLEKSARPSNEAKKSSSSGIAVVADSHPSEDSAVSHELNERKPLDHRFDHSWLVSSEMWQKHRDGLPNAIVLAPSGPVFSAGHDLQELSTLNGNEVRRTFSLCAEVMHLIRRSPAPVIAVVQGPALAAGAQLALTADYVIALRDTRFVLPGMGIGLPCSSPSTAVSRRAGNARTFRMLSMPGEGCTAGDMPEAIDCVDVDLSDTVDPDEIAKRREKALWTRVQTVVKQIAVHNAAQPQAQGKWAFWTQAGMRDHKAGFQLRGGDDYESAVAFAGRVMALHAQSDDAKEGIQAFLEKRRPVWKT